MEGLLLAVAADQDGQLLLEGRRVVADVLRLVSRTACGRVHPVQHLAHEIDGLVEPVEPLAETRAEINPVGLVLPPEPGAPDAKDGAAPADVIKRRDHLRGECRVAEGVGADHQPKRHPAGHRRPARQRQVALEDGAAPVALDGVEVVPRPERVIPQLVGPSAGALQ